MGGLFYVPHNQRFNWLRGLDLNQRPLGYEWNFGADAEQQRTARPKYYCVIWTARLS